MYSCAGLFALEEVNYFRNKGDEFGSLLLQLNVEVPVVTSFVYEVTTFRFLSHGE